MIVDRSLAFLRPVFADVALPFVCISWLNLSVTGMSDNSTVGRLREEKWDLMILYSASSHGVGNTFFAIIRVA